MHFIFLIGKQVVDKAVEYLTSQRRRKSLQACKLPFHFNHLQRDVLATCELSLSNQNAL
jgi:hypothetical protein